MSQLATATPTVTDEKPAVEASPKVGGPLDGPASAVRKRLDSIDLLRGLVMVLMLLDHTRDFFHSEALRFDPTDLTKTNAPLFFTRWITHFCAPVFVFLAGTGAYLQFMRGKSRAELSRFLITRGFWLVVLEFTLVRIGFAFNFDYSFLGAAQVIWVIGVSMIVLAGLIYLPTRMIAAFGIGMIALHNLLDGIQVTQWQGPGTPLPSASEKLWMFLHQQGAFPLFEGGPFLFVAYPLIPWIGVMAAGYAFGALYKLEAERRQRLLIRLGLALTALFIVVRAINVYGDPRSWETQSSAMFTLMSFLNVSKYPPSLLYLLMTIGPSLLLLAYFEKTRRSAAGRALVTLGRVPLFYYLLQWPVAHLLALILTYLMGKSIDYLFLSPPFNFMAAPPDAGFNLGVVYLFWIVGLFVLYPLCLWFSRVKQRRRDWWLSYL